MRPWRNRHLSIALHLIIWLTILVICWNIFRAGDKPRKDKAKDKPTEVLWWSSAMSWSYDEIRTCGIHKCRFTNNRQRLSQAMAVLFYGSNMKMHDFPLPRLPQHIWALLHEESPRNVPFVPFNEFLRHFNYTSTFSRHSDLPLTTQYLPGVSELTTMKYFNDFYTKSFHFTHVIFLQSDCDTMSGREDYVKELIRHIRVDSYGKCLHNKDLPPSLQEDYLNRMYSTELLNFFKHYKFMIAIENGICNDYITEKFWRPLVAGVIPIYFGSPTIKDWQPQNKSAIYVDDFPNAAALAEYLLFLADNQTEYDSYRQHKLNSANNIDNKRLIENIMTRYYQIDETQKEGSSLFQKFECAMCQRLASSEKYKSADVRHYECPLPPIHAPLSNKQEPHHAEDWRSMMEVGRCQAQLLDNFFQANRSFTQEQFEQKLYEC
ncbi:uncharacterized protein Dwil_GK24808 [Drosophila willistoni]|uniref:Fucosyltransferase n=1 Tax=Drosophila willistoni TaxID=7260 RepID=B4N1D7_DROWI|nr:alpha-(1,3)-fucosyltransferase B isoform X1 [Drosophila willistoni]EDW78074.1 uncharacterized protein Dwil_GK24808 [Drosophila willistoni]